MNGYRESAFTRNERGGGVLICSVNWLGDAVMAMPAVQAFKERHPETPITVLARPTVMPLWRMNPAVDAVWPFPLGAWAIFNAAARVRTAHFSVAYVLPHSIRSALPAVLGGVPQRIGLPGPFRRLLMTRVVEPPRSPERRHQCWEYIALMAPWIAGFLPSPTLRIPPAARKQALQKLPLADSTLCIGLIPGAARGPAKRWPAERFVEVGRRLASTWQARILVFGAPNERDLCETVAAAIGPLAVSTAGRLEFDEWVATLTLCRLVISNDNGGMHVAAALNVPVVAIFGLTDPERTGPLGAHARVIQAPHITGRRDISRDDRQARAALDAVTVEEVCRISNTLLAETGLGHPGVAPSVRSAP